MVSIAGSLVSKHRNHGFLFPGMLVSEGPDTGVTSPGILTLERAPKWVRILSIAPLLVYWVAGIAFMLIDLEGVLGLVSVYALILPAIVATYKWFKWYQSTEEVDDYALPTTYAYVFDPLYDGEEETEEEA